LRAFMTLLWPGRAILHDEVCISIRLLAASSNRDDERIGCN
jgi:hypothetical protein